MKIVMAAGEITPYAKTGGLGDVMAALPRALAAMGHEVVVFVPFYRQVREHLPNARPVPGSFTVPMGGLRESGEICAEMLDARLMLAMVKHDGFFDRPALYGDSNGLYGDNGERFIFFSKAVVAGVSLLRFAPDVLHAHDWHAALIPLFWRREMGVAWKLRTVFTIHNLAYQGVFPADQFELTNLPPEFFALYGLEFHHQINFMKAGLLYSDVVNTVSPRYAEEIRTPEFGCGLDGLLRDLGPKLVGVLNGIDTAEWNPETDRHIAARYSADDMTGKAVCKRALLEAFKLPADRERAPLIGIVARLEHQKGLDLVADAVPALMGMDATLVVLASGNPALEARYRELAQRYAGQFGLHIGFSSPMAHQIEAGSDMFLMPSRFEPCGLNQMYSLRYGTVPIVRAVGGLADTVQQFDPATGQGTGFRFDEASVPAVLSAVSAAIGTWRRPDDWRRLMRNGMACDFSWRRSAERYVELYKAV